MLKKDNTNDSFFCGCSGALADSLHPRPHQ